MSCSICGTQWNGVFCLNCARKQEPKGPALVAVHRYGFNPCYTLRRDIKVARSMGAVVTASDPDGESVTMSRLFVACDGKTYVARTEMFAGGAVGWDEPWTGKAQGGKEGA
jgi:hypothetical protein